MSRSLIYHAFFVLNQIFSFSMNLLLHSVRRCRLPDGCPDCCADAVLHGVADGYGYHPVPVPVLPVTRIAGSAGFQLCVKNVWPDGDYGFCWRHRLCLQRRPGPLSGSIAVLPADNGGLHWPATGQPCRHHVGNPVNGGWRVVVAVLRGCCLVISVFRWVDFVATTRRFPAPVRCPCWLVRLTGAGHWHGTG